MKPLKWLLILPIAALCVACGEKQDYSGSNELAKQPAKTGAADPPPAGGPSSHKGMMVDGPSRKP